MNATEKQIITLCKDNYEFGYKFYIPKTKEIISICNYKRMNFNEYPTQVNLRQQVLEILKTILISKLEIHKRLFTLATLPCSCYRIPCLDPII